MNMSANCQLSSQITKPIYSYATCSDTAPLRVVNFEVEYL